MWSKYTEDHFNVICIIDRIVCMHVMYCTINIHTTICETWVSEGKPEFLNILTTIYIYYVFNFRFSIENRSLWKIWNNYSFIGIVWLSFYCIFIFCKKKTKKNSAFLSKKSKKYFDTYISTLTYLFQITFSVQNGVKFKNALASTCLFGEF